MKIELDVSEESMRQIELLKVKTGLKTTQELLNNAITLYSWAVEERAAGRQICSAGHNNAIRALRLPALEFAARNFAKSA